jgi:predicted permease
MRTVIQRAKNTPGVRAAALATNRPLNGGLLGTILAEGQEADPNQRGTLTAINTVSPEYFDTMGIHVVGGRGFNAFDREGSAHAAIVNQAMARHFWPGQDAIGKRFRITVQNFMWQVVGICGDSVTTTIGEQPQPVAYFPLDQNYSAALALITRTAADPAGVMPAVRREVQSLNQNMALTNANTIKDLIGQGLWAPRTGAALFAIFGALGMLLASIGIYGVMAYSVTQRTNEIGLRMALGASPWDVLRLVVGQGMRLTVAGVAVGVVAALGVTRLLGNLLFGISTYDPVTFGSVSAVVVMVAFLAAYLPAQRAARIDPVRALRQE